MGCAGKDWRKLEGETVMMFDLIALILETILSFFNDVVADAILGALQIGEE